MRQKLDEFTKNLNRQYPYFIGFPAATDFDYSELYPFLGYILNNVGDPYTDPLHANHTNELEREVVAFFADLFRAPADDRWGYVTSGGTEGNLYALYVARTLYPNAVVYYSSAAHYSIPKSIHILNMTSQEVAILPSGEVDYVDLRQQISRNRTKPAIVIANIGTTMTEAKDDVRAIRSILRSERIASSFIHSDAALAGVYTAMLEPHHPFDFADGADSVSISGHKFVGSPMACGVVLARKSHSTVVSRSALYAGGLDATISGSRNGHTPLFLWYAIRRFGREGLLSRAKEGLRLAEYAYKELKDTPWNAWRNPNALTVVFKTPSARIVRKWQLASHDGWSHVICMPGVTRQRQMHS